MCVCERERERDKKTARAAKFIRWKHGEAICFRDENQRYHWHWQPQAQVLLVAVRVHEVAQQQVHR
jgi:hypothetical protein